MMHMKFNTLVLFSILGLLCSCKTQQKIQKTLSPAEKILNKTLAAHGGDKYANAHYQFVFRNKTYTFKNNNDFYEYRMTQEKDGKKITSILNKGFTRTSTGQPLTEKHRKGAAASLNSVIYFATLPYKLMDKAVNKKHVGSTTIKEKDYEILEISFDKEGGGTDHDDVFYYWINKENHVIDYLAYNYQVSGGGVRFRSAYNTRNVGGILFQDYINYKAAVGTPLRNLPKLWEQGILKELSRIETEDIKQLSIN